MGLFRLDQMEQINKVAERSKSVLPPTKSTGKSSSIMDKLNSISQDVINYFADSPAKLITSKAELHDYVTKFIECGIGGIDTETTGLDRIHDTIVGASLYYPGAPEVYIPSRHLVPILDTPYKDQLTYAEIGEEFQRLANGAVKLIFANADFDLAMIYKDLKVDLNKSCYFDVLLAWRCLKENEQKNGLKELYNKYVLKGKGEPKKFSDFFPPDLFPYCKPAVAGLYAANDAKITYELFKFEEQYLDPTNVKCQKNHLERIADLAWDIEMPLISVCQNLHRNGIYLDKNIIKILKSRYDSKLKVEQDKLAKMIDDILISNEINIKSSKTKQPFYSGRDFNPNSTIHVPYLIYTVLGCPPDKDGKRPADKEKLEELNLPVTKQILAVRSFIKLIGTYIDKLPNETTSDSRIHAEFRQIGADCVTGDTIIPTNHGYYTIGDICESHDCLEGEHVEVDDITIINKDQNTELATTVIKYTDYPTIRITTEFGFTIEGTYNHPIMVSKYSASDNVHRTTDKRIPIFWDDRRFRTLDQIKIGDFVEIPCNYSDEIKSEYQPTNLELVPYRYGGLESKVKLPTVFDEEFALFLGIYHADGSARFREGTYSIRISNDDPYIIEVVGNLFESLFNLKTSVMLDKRHNGGESIVSNIQISSIDSILSHGKQNKKIPAAIYKSPVSVINSYIKGMTLDSSVSTEKSTNRLRFMLTVCDCTDARFIQVHLASQGIICSIKSQPMRCGKLEYRLIFNADNYFLFRDLIGFVDPSKYVAGYPCHKNGYNVRRIGNSFRVKVKSIEYSRNTVYDLHVPETHSFISNGIISHNTGRLASKNPNMQNIPSKVTDIRHIFRATPPMNTNVNCIIMDDKLSIILHRYDRVHTPVGMKTVKDLELGDYVLIDHYGEPMELFIHSIEECSDDLSSLKIVFNQRTDSAEGWKLNYQTPAYVMISSDYSAQEPRITAFVSGDKEMIKIFKEDRDIYGGIASLSFELPYEKCLEFHPETKEYQPDGKARRTEAKRILLGICYGRAIPSIAEQLYGERDDMTDEEKLKSAQKVYDSVLRAFSGLKSFMVSVKRFAIEHGYVETILGRRRHVPEIRLPEYEFSAMKGYVNPDVDPLDVNTLKNSSDIPDRIKQALYKELMSYRHFGQRANRIKELYENEHIRVINNHKKIQDGERKLVNSVVQGSAADQSKMAMLVLENDIRWKKICGRLLIPVHDELIAEVPMEAWEEGGKILSEDMCSAASFLPFNSKCDVTTTLRWYGEEFPCKYPKPQTVDTEDPEEVKWLQWHFREMEYLLPVFKEPDGSKPKGDPAHGINGIITEEYKDIIEDYLISRDIFRPEFIDFIDDETLYGREYAYKNNIKRRKESEQL